MVEATENRERDHARTLFRPLDLSGIRGAFLERKMGPRRIVVGLISEKDSAMLAVVPQLDRAQLVLGELPSSAWPFVKATGRFGGAFPASTAPELMKVLEGLGAVTLNLPASLAGQELPADGRVHAQLVLDARLSLRLQLMMEPLAGAPTQLPGEGPVRLSSWRREGRVHALRDLVAEATAVDALIARLALPAEARVGPHQWQVSEPDAALELLERLQGLGSDVVLKTEGPRVLRALAPADLKVAIRQKLDWFALEGQASVDGLVIPLARVLEAIRGGRSWVELGTHQFARLSAQLVERLAPIALSTRSRGDSPEVTLADAPALELLEGQIGALEWAGAFKRIVERMRASRGLKPRLPTGLTATLRDYQRDGFTWLSRLAAWGAGAVLADDMGLGKTVQALALLAARAKLGPALVVGRAELEARGQALHAQTQGDAVARRWPSGGHRRGRAR